MTKKADLKEYFRLHDYLLDYYKTLLHMSNGQIPSEDKINYKQIKPAWDDCFLIKMEKKGKYKFQYMGKNIIAAYGSKISIKDLDSIIAPEEKHVAQKYDVVVDKKEVIYDEGEFTNQDNVEIKYRQIMMPFTDKNDDSGEVKYVFGGMRWKKY